MDEETEKEKKIKLDAETDELSDILASQLGSAEAVDQPRRLPWLAIGDFNELVGLSEKEGGVSRPASQMERFKEVIDVCGLKDLGFIDPRFTWLYQKFDGSQIRERLDRALATCDWMGKFPAAKHYHLSSLVSNHCPLALHFVRRQKRRIYHRPFKFESMWLKSEKCEEVVQKAWDVGLMRGSAFPLTSCLESCRDSLDEWKKNDFGHGGMGAVESFGMVRVTTLFSFNYC
ncbi:hypothetical protein SO802_015468 [Lithocarpus litseifolius]|uniref:Uncharacterized protein n=1 Tax=Lithocarpus litseifolius TaxID=425828 RepID=A0AAW2CTS1_9ROSI